MKEQTIKQFSHFIISSLILIYLIIYFKIATNQYDDKTYLGLDQAKICFSFIDISTASSIAFDNNNNNDNDKLNGKNRQLSITSQSTTEVLSIFGVSHDCYECSYHHLIDISLTEKKNENINDGNSNNNNNNNNNIILNVNYPWDIKVRDNSTGEILLQWKLNELANQGIYQINITRQLNKDDNNINNSGGTTAVFTTWEFMYSTVKRPVNSYLPLIILFSSIFAFFLLIQINDSLLTSYLKKKDLTKSLSSSFIHNSYNNNNNNNNNNNRNLNLLQTTSKVKKDGNGEYISLLFNDEYHNQEMMANSNNKIYEEEEEDEEKEEEEEKNNHHYQYNNNSSDDEHHDTTIITQTNSNTMATTTTTNIDNTPTTEKRLKALDIFRGLTITLMIFVNYGGGGYYFFQHSTWNGLTIADVLFPWFIWISGTSVAFSMKSFQYHLDNAETQNEIKLLKLQKVSKIFQRSMTLIAIGLFISNGFYLKTWRYTGVLQYFGFSILVVQSMIVLLSSSSQRRRRNLNSSSLPLLPSSSLPSSSLPSSSPSSSSSSTTTAHHIILDNWKELPFMFSLLILNYIITYWLKMEGCPRGYIGAGGNYSKYPMCTGGTHLYIDKILFGENHIYKNPTCQIVYNTNEPYDPEGFIGVLNAAFLFYMGIYAGRIYLYHQNHNHNHIHQNDATGNNKSPRMIIIQQWLLWSFVFCLLAGILCGFSQNNGYIPINKNLWSTSFIFLTGGFGFFLLSILYYITSNNNDVLLLSTKYWNTGTPFHFIGMNSLLLYIGHEFFNSYFPFQFHVHETHEELLMTDIIGVILWIFIAYFFHLKKYYFTV